MFISAKYLLGLRFALYVNSKADLFSAKSKSKNLNEILLFCLDHLRTNSIYFNPNQANDRGETINGDFMKTAIITLNYNITNLDIPIINTHKSKNNIKL